MQVFLFTALVEAMGMVLKITDHNQDEFWIGTYDHWILACLRGNNCAQELLHVK